MVEATKMRTLISYSYVFMQLSFIACPLSLLSNLMFNRITEKITDILSDQPSVCEDFSIHHDEWLVHSNITNEEGKYCHDLTS